jgi:hypothetical protein
MCVMHEGPSTTNSAVQCVKQLARVLTGGFTITPLRRRLDQTRAGGPDGFQHLRRCLASLTAALQSPVVAVHGWKTQHLPAQFSQDSDLQVPSDICMDPCVCMMPCFSGHSGAALHMITDLEAFYKEACKTGSIRSLP